MAVVPSCDDDGTRPNEFSIGNAPATPSRGDVVRSTALRTICTCVAGDRPRASCCTTATRASAGNAKSWTTCRCVAMAGRSSGTTAEKSAVPTECRSGSSNTAATVPATPATTITHRSRMTSRA